MPAPEEENDSMGERMHNFSAGPAALPLPVLQKVQEELLCYPGAGASVMEISHRSKAFEGIIQHAEADLRSLLGIGDSHAVLFMQGGATLQFSALAMNFLRGSGKPGDFILTGSWGEKAFKEAKKEGEVRTAFTNKDENFKRLPKAGELDLDPNAAFVHFTSNETIQGVEFMQEPEVGGAPLFCDASSDFLSHPLDINKYGLLYAGAQKNIGPAGLAVAIVRKDLLERTPDGLPSMMDYKLFAENESLYNTPACFSIYVVGLVLKWLKDDIGGLEKMHAQNEKKAAILYDLIDNSGGFYRGHAEKDCRSLMNVTWTLETPELEAELLAGAKERNLDGLKGHRSVGGLRASIYNACPVESVQTLADYMTEFHKQKG